MRRKRTSESAVGTRQRWDGCEVLRCENDDAFSRRPVSQFGSLAPSDFKSDAKGLEQKTNGVPRHRNEQLELDGGSA